MKRRTELSRGKGLAPGVGLKSTKQLETRQGLETTKGLETHKAPRARSRKMARLYRSRRQMVARILQERPFCEVHWDFKCQRFSVDVHEVILRSAGGAIVGDEGGQRYVSACRSCHTMITENPNEARERGWRA